MKRLLLPFCLFFSEACTLTPMDRLDDGYEAFYETADSRLYAKLAKKGQHPHTLVISCADSRVVPEIIFNAQPGELFVLRNVGGLAGPDAAQAGIEYALNTLNIKNIVLLSHQDCGAVKALKETNGPGPFLKKWLADESPAPGDEKEAVLAHAVRQYEKVLRHPSVQQAALDENFRISVMVFDIRTHSLKVYNPQKKSWKKK